jgi:hypothetical protein
MHKPLNTAHAATTPWVLWKDMCIGEAGVSVAQANKHIVRISQAYMAGEAVWAFAPELALRVEGDSIRRTKSPREYATRVVMVA